MTQSVFETLLSKITDESAAESLGISRSQMSKVRRGQSLPSLELAVKIEDTIGIPPRFWIKRRRVSHADTAEPTGIDGAFSGEAV